MVHTYIYHHNNFQHCVHSNLVKSNGNFVVMMASNTFVITLAFSFCDVVKLTFEVVSHSSQLRIGTLHFWTLTSFHAWSSCLFFSKVFYFLTLGSLHSKFVLILFNWCSTFSHSTKLSHSKLLFIFLWSLLFLHFRKLAFEVLFQSF